MHNNNSEEVHYKELLKLYVEQKFGKEVRYSKDCRLLSEQVYKATGKQLSMSTIKRFFNIIHSPFNPSRYTLDAFSGYLENHDWKSFIEAKRDEGSGETDNRGVEYLKRSFQIITKTSCVSLSRKVRYNKVRFVYRTFAETFFEEFVTSGKTATMLIAPTGHGKSAILLQWMRTYFTGKDSRFRDDVVGLIDGGIFFTLYSQAQDNELLTQLLDFDFKTIQELFVKQKANPNKVRYFIIIDDVDRVFSVREKYYLLAENIMRLIMLNQDNPWFKIILTCRPENLDIFTSLVINNPLLAEAFYKINFLQKNNFDFVNVPLFSNSEVKRAFSNYKRKQSYYYLSLNYPDVLKIISAPNYFSFFIRYDNTSPENFTEIDFINHLMQHFYYSQPFAGEKHQLIKKFIRLCSTNKDDFYVRKELLLEENECRLAYQELIKAGLLYEYLDTSNRNEVQLNVRFSNGEIFEYLLAWSIVKKNGLNSTLINLVFEKYRNIIPIQYSLLRWFVKIAFFEGDTSFLKQLHQSMANQIDVSKRYGKESIPGAVQSIQTAFIESFRTKRKVGVQLLPEFAKTELGQRFYFEEFLDMDNLMNIPENSLLVFVNNNKTTDGEMIFHFVNFIKRFYQNDFNSCSAEFKKISRINYTELSSPLALGYYFSSWFLYAYLNNFGKREDMMKKFLAASENLRAKGSPSLRFNPGFELFVVYHLNLCNFFTECRFAAEHFNGLKNSFQNKTSGFYQYYRLCYARSLLHTGEQKQAQELYRQLSIKDFPFHMRYFMQINVNLAKYDFLEHQNKTAEALNLLHESRLLANQMHYNYFSRKAEELEYELLKTNSDLPS